VVRLERRITSPEPRTTKQEFPLKIVVDAMGGDHAPQAVVAGVVDAVNGFHVPIALVGLEDQVKKELSHYKYPSSLIEIIHAPEVVGMDEPATNSIRKKKNCSISVGINLLKDPAYSAFVSAGNTGAVVCASTVFLGMLPGVERPGIGVILPTLKKFSLLIDMGANTEAKAEHLVQYALMANIYAQNVLDIPSPTIGLLNIGSEEGKGTDLAKETYKLLSEKLANFSGNVEASEVYTGKADCIICDGFVGNVVLKVSEGLLECAGTLIKREIKKNPVALLGAFLMKKGLSDFKRRVDYSEYGGAPLLGVNGAVIISHGRSNAKAIKNAIRSAQREVEHDFIAKIVEAVR